MIFLKLFFTWDAVMQSGDEEPRMAAIRENEWLWNELHERGIYLSEQCRIVDKPNFTQSPREWFIIPDWIKTQDWNVRWNVSEHPSKAIGLRRKTLEKVLFSKCRERVHRPTKKGWVRSSIYSEHQIIYLFFIQSFPHSQWNFLYLISFIFHKAFQI